jgi:uncharacterized 2Fe-2S/4Fe-4S cluster protein (DUF4445 family)
MKGRTSVTSSWVRTVALETPVLGNNISDAQRLEQHLKSETAADHIHIPLMLLRELPSKLRQWDFRLKLVLFRSRYGWQVLDMIDPDSDNPILGAAIDIGTTRIVMALINLETGERLGEVSFDNPQIQFGPDVLSRIHYSEKDNGLKELQTEIIDSVNFHIASLCNSIGSAVDDLYIITGAGNTSMTHLFLGIDASQIIREPYIPCANIFDTLSARLPGLEIHPNGKLFLFPNIGSYFGGDLISGILYSELDRKESPSLMVDVGTNAEIVVGSREWLIACAGAAGPALEGGVSKMGMTAGPGVIDKVWIDEGIDDLKVHTIDELPPVGICGSGMIDLAASLFLSGRIDIRGRFVKDKCGGRLVEENEIEHFVLVDATASGTGKAICLSQVDLNSLTSSKAAMYTILEVIVTNTAGLDFNDLEKFHVAGTFGSFIDPRSAICIGMLPDLPVDMFEVLGNSSLGGAVQLLRDPDSFDRIFNIRESITYIELNVNQEFMNMFSGAKFYPHTDVSKFPSLTGKI